MKRVVFTSNFARLLGRIGTFGLFVLFSAPALFGQYALQNGIPTTSGTSVVQAYYNSSNPETRIVPTQYQQPGAPPSVSTASLIGPGTIQVSDQGLIEPKTLSAPGLASSVQQRQNIQNTPNIQYSQPSPHYILASHPESSQPKFSTAAPQQPGIVSQPFIAAPAQSAPLPQTTYSQPTVQTAPQAVPAAPQRLIAKEAITKNHRLQHLTSEAFEQRFVQTLGRRFVPIRNVEASQNLSRFRLPVKDGTDVELSIDRQNALVTIVGSAAMVDSSLQIVRLLDAPNTPERTTVFMPVEHATVASVKQAAEIVNRETQKDAPPKIAQVPPAFRRSGEDATARFNPNAPQTESEDNAGSLLGPVQIDVIEDLGTLSIVGPKRDVEIVLEMLRQLEAMSKEYEPVLEFVPLKQADSYRVSQMVQQLYAQVYLSRHGSITMIPLIKPNTILIVGKKESVEAAKELIAKLDTEVAPKSEFLVVRLKNAAAETLQTQITNFYINEQRQGLGLEAQVFVVADYRTNSLIIQASPRDLTEVAAMIRELDRDHSDTVNAVKTFPLKNAMASELATTLQNAIAGTSTAGGTGSFGGGAGTTTQSGRTRGHDLELATIDDQGNRLRANVLYDVRITADTRSNTLIVSAPRDSMPLIEALVKQLDQLPSAESQIKVFTLVNGDASALTTVLQNLFATTTSGTGGGGFGGTSGQTSQIATVRPGIEEGESTLVSVRFQTDVRTNSIIACGSAGDMAVVEAILMRLDEENMNNRKVMVIKPLNTAAADIATAIQSYMTNERQLEIQNSSTYYPQSPQEQYRKEVVVVAEEVTNTLIISTTPRYFDMIRQLVAELDDRPLMVAIQVLIAEVTLNNNRELGVELGLQDSVLFDRSIDGIPGFNFTNPLLAWPNDMSVRPSQLGNQGITSLGVGRVSGDKTYGGFTFSASNDSVSILVRALEEQGKLRVLSRPHLTTMHNLRGSLQVGERVPYVTNANSNDSGGMSSSVDFQDVGIILDVTPRIAPDNQIVMDLFAEKSYVGNPSDGIPIYKSGTGEDNTIYSPRINVTRAQTTVSAQDGETIVFAGLITEEKEFIERGVPFLNRIPVVKHLFEYKSSRCYRKELLIIMTPTIIRNEMDMQILKQQESARMHWCLSDVVRLTGNSCMRMRCHDWAPNDVPYTHAEAVILDDSQLPSEDKVRMMYPNPANIPDGIQ